MAVTRCGGCGRLLPDGVPGCGNCGRPVDWVPTPYVPVEDVVPPRPVAASLPMFPVATHKFVLLSVCTFGAYVVYWCYQNWVRIKDASGTDISPFWRAVMAPVSCYWLFKEIRAVADGRGLRVGWHPAVLATLYFAMSALANLPSEWSLVSILSVLPLIPVHQATVRINDLDAAHSSEDRNSTYSGANLAVIVVGGVVLLAAVATVFQSENATTPDSKAPQTIDAYRDDAPAAVRAALAVGIESPDVNR